MCNIWILTQNLATEGKQEMNNEEFQNLQNQFQNLQNLHFQVKTLVSLK